jgi:hypothetical protein
MVDDLCCLYMLLLFLFVIGFCFCWFVVCVAADLSAGSR